MYCHGSQSVKASASGREKPHNGRILGAYQAGGAIRSAALLVPFGNYRLSSNIVYTLVEVLITYRS